jgi:hypothetical protein
LSSFTVNQPACACHPNLSKSPPFHISFSIFTIEKYIGALQEPTAIHFSLSTCIIIEGLLCFSVSLQETIPITHS